MPRPKKKRMGRPKGSKNKPKNTVEVAPVTKAMQSPKMITTSGFSYVEPSFAQKTECKDVCMVELQSMIWDSLRSVYTKKVPAAEVREVLDQANKLLTAMELTAPFA